MWDEKRIGDFAKLITKGTTPTSVGCKFEDSGINYIKSESIGVGRRLDKSKYAFISEETHEKLKRSQIEEGDILFSMAGAYLGKTGIVTNTDVPANTNQAVAIIRLDTEKINPRFVYYVLNQPSMVALVNSTSSQSAQPNINLKDIGNLIFECPDRATQDRIVNLLSNIDDIIENNEKINRNLSEQAQVIFVNRFVDATPEGEQKPLYDFAEYINGTSFKKDEYKAEGVPIIKIAELKNGITGSTQYFTGEKDKKYDVKNGDILFSWSGNPDTSIDVFIWTHGHGILNQHTFNVKTNDDYKWFVFLMLKYFKSEFAAIASNKQTTGLGHVTVADLKRLTFVYAREEIESFENEVTPIMNLIYNNMIENRKLESLRDSLLPKLMSGELDVSDLDN